MPTEKEAVELLEELGLTEYEARCFVALSRVRKATAKEVSDLSEVPRSRVYDAVDRLHRRGLVDVQQSEPREYKAISTDEAIETLREQYSSTLSELDDALNGLRKSENLEESGAWAIADHEHVTERIESLIADADEEIYVLVTDERAAERRLRHQMADASERGVEVLVEAPSEGLAEQFREDVPDAMVAMSGLADDTGSVEDKWLSRIVMVDRRSMLMGALTDGARPGSAEETAIWASGQDHGLVVGLRHLLGARIDGQGVFE